MQVIVNDDPQTIEPGTTVSQLLEQLGIEPRYLAVERNLRLVPRAEHEACVLQSGDRLEIVTLVGGG